jgi:hypothetical protein
MQLEPKESQAWMMPNMFGKRPTEQYFRYTYVRIPTYRRNNSDYLRHDMRMFNLGTIVKRMAAEIKELGLQNAIADNGTRLAFIQNIGFVKSTQLEVKEYFVNQSIVTSLMMDSRTMMFNKLPDPDSMFAKGGIVDANATGGMNNVLMNPTVLQKYMNIMNNGTQEARAYMAGVLQQQYAQANGGMSQQMPSVGAMGMPMQPMAGMGMAMQPPMMGGVGMQPQMGMGMGMPMNGMMGMQQPMMGGGWNTNLYHL